MVFTISRIECLKKIFLSDFTAIFPEDPYKQVKGANKLPQRENK